MSQDNKYDIKVEWIGPHDDDPPCAYNKSVGCRSHKCESCGWNPVVSIDRITSKYGSYAVKFLTKVEM